MCNSLNSILSRHNVSESLHGKLLKHMNSLKVGDENPLVLFAWNTENLELFHAAAMAVAHMIPEQIDCTTTTTLQSSMIECVARGSGVHLENVYSCVGFCCMQSELCTACCYLRDMEVHPWLQAVLNNYNGGAIARIMINKPYSRLHEMMSVDMPGCRLWEGPQ